MKEEKEKKSQQKTSGRRKFLKLGLVGGVAAVTGGVGLKALAKTDDTTGKKVKLLSTDGKLVEVDEGNIDHHCSHGAVSPAESRKGIPGRKFVMVIDLAKCKNARKCVKACGKAHHIDEGQEWIKVLKMQESEKTSPYWMPKPCLHCDDAPCVKVCPTQASFKRSDGIVLIDTTLCMGCRYCMVACPYSSRVVYNVSKNSITPMELVDDEGNPSMDYSPESSLPKQVGVVAKCDFCPDMIRQGKLPHCIPACPMGVFYFGDIYEDTVTNGDETLRFSELIRDKAGYRIKEHLGTNPSVYYLPPVNRSFPFKDEEKTEETNHS